MVHRSATILLFAVTTLIVIGLVILSSTSVWSDEMRGAEDPYQLVKKHCVWLMVGGLGATLLTKIDYLHWMRHWKLFLGAAVILLTLCYIPHVRHESNGEFRWISIFGRFTIQPSELAKPAVVLSLAAWLAFHQAEVHQFRKGFLIPGMILGCCCLLILFEKDLGTTMVLGMVGGAILFLAGTRLRYLLTTAGVAGAALFTFVKNDEIRWRRMTAHWNMDDPEVRLGDGWQTFRALEAFGNGGIWGTGLGNGAEKHGALPFAHTDFIFAALGEELGLVVTLLAVLCFVVIVIAGMLIAVHARDPFGKLLATGLTLLIVVPGILNMGVVTGMLPVTGLPLPFLSYGGSNLVFTLLSVGLLLSVHRKACYQVKFQKADARMKSYALKI